MFGLCGDGRDVLFFCRGFLLRCGADGHATGAAVKTDAVNRGAVFYFCVVDVVVDRDVHVANRLVVGEVPVFPAAAFVAIAKIAVTITNAAVEPDLCSPVAIVEEVRVVVPAPIAWRPEIAGFGSHDPRAGYPEVIVITVSPVTRCPDSAVLGADGLVVDGEFGRGGPD